MGFEAWEKREILKFHILPRSFASFYWKRMLYYITLLFSVIFFKFYVRYFFKFTYSASYV